MEPGYYTVEVVNISDQRSGDGKTANYKVLKLQVIDNCDDIHYLYVSTANTKLFIKMMSIAFTFAFVNSHDLMRHLGIAALFMFGKQFTVQVAEEPIHYQIVRNVSSYLNNGPRRIFYIVDVIP